MASSSLRKMSYWSLVSLTAFNAVSAVGGGIAVLATGGLGMPRSMLANGPFDTFTVPGIILLVVIGGTQALATALLLRREESSLAWSAVAGFGMIVWIFVETGIISGISWLQAIYFASGLLQLVLVLALLGVAGVLPREKLRSLAPPLSEPL
jgi:hypothetical protein